MILSTLLLLPALVAAAPATVPLRLEEAAGVARRSWPVTMGVPLARGALADPARAGLRDPAGRPVDLQTRALSRWEDGSVKWLLLDFLADVPAGQSASYALETGAPARPPAKTDPRVTVTQTAGQVVVDTGAVRFAVDRARFGVFSQVRAGGIALWSGPGEMFVDLEHTPPGPPQEENWLRDSAGGPRDRYTAGDSGYKVVVEEAGPVRATLRIEGWHANAEGKRFAPYVIRLYACAGQSFVRVLHTFTFTGNPKEDFIRAMGWRFPAPAGAVSTHVALPEGATGTAPAKPPWSLVEVGPEKIYHLAPYTQDKDVRFQVLSGGKVAAEGKEAPGAVAVSAKAGGVALAVRDFWQQHPKEIRCDAAGRLTLYFWPEEGGKVLDLRRRSDEIDNVLHYDLSMWAKGGRGLAKTHEFLLDFSAGPADAGRAGRLSRCLDEPLWALAPPEHYAATGAFGRFLPRDAKRFPRIEAQMDFALAWIRRNQQAFHWDGMIDYGDTFFLGYETQTHAGYRKEKAWGSRGYVGWLNNDSELTHSLFLHALRGGDRKVFRTAEAMVRHVMDVDTCHYDPEEPAHVGGGHRHDQQHWGNHLVGNGPASHGNLDVSLLTGDARALDVARENGNFHLGGVGENEDRYAGLLRLWEVTGEQRFREGAEKVLEAELAVPAEKEWPFATGRHFRFISNTSTGFVMADTVRLEERLRKAIVRAAASVEKPLTSAWQEPGYLPEILVAEAYRHTGDRRYVEMAKAMVKTLHIPALDPAKLWPQGLDQPPFEEIARLSGVTGINNVYSANIQQLCSLPYLLAALGAAGATEADCDAFQPRTDAVDPFEEELDPARITREMATNLWHYELKHGAPSDIRGGRSTLELYEDGKLLGPAHASHADTRTLGGGRWSHWGAHSLWFSTSDNSDPRTNGRKYKAVQR